MKSSKSKLLQRNARRAAISAATGSLLLGAMNASAALSTEATTAIANTQLDITEAGGLLITLAVVAMGLRWVKATFF